MGRSSVRGTGALVGIALFLAACGSSKKTLPSGNDGEGDGGAGGSGDVTVCTPGVRRCDGLNIKVCSGDGQSELIELTCATGLTCRSDSGGTRCDTRSCTPNAAVCNGNQATTCLADGSGPDPSGDDCGAHGQICTDGECKPVDCKSGESFCSNGDLYLCGKNGKTVSLTDDCQMNEVCDGDAAACRLRVCEPSQAVCQGSVAKTCNAFGSDWVDSKDCAKDQQKCLSGACSDMVCEPARRYCQDDNIVQCNASGTELTLSQACNSATQFCSEAGGGFAYCNPDVCTPGEPVCDQNMVKICNDNGSLPATGTYCNDGWCQDGACVPRTCTEGTYFCQDGDVYYCSYGSDPPYLQLDCSGGTACTTAGTMGVDPGSQYNAFCAPLPCDAGDTVCLGNQVGTCAADEQSLSQVTTDCAASSKVCSVDAKCAASAVDLIGADEGYGSISADTFTGDMVEVHSDRKLTQLRMWLAFQSARQLRWVIFEQSGSLFVAKADKVSNVATSSGFVASPAFDFDLKAGKRYLLGVALTGGDAISPYDYSPYEPRLSFGVLLGGNISAYATTLSYLEAFSTDVLYQVEVTTEP